MARGVSGVIMRAFGGRDHVATVLSREELTAHCIRLSFSCPGVMAGLDVGPAAWLRFWFPAAGSTMEYQRAYTLLDADPAAGTFGIDVMLHEPSGPAAAWAAHAQPGDTVSVMTLGATRFTLPDTPPAGVLLLGDSASLPGMRSILAAVPPEVSVVAYLEEHDPADRDLPLGEHPRLSLHWVPRADASSLAAAVEARDWSGWVVWAAAEAGTLKLVRKRLRDEFGLPKRDVHAQAYWSHGRAMGTAGSAASDAAPALSNVPRPS